MNALRSFRRGRLRSIRSIAVVSVLILAGLMWIGAAQAVHDNGMFELDGNTVHNAATTPPYDWNSLFDANGNRLITPDPINGPLLADTFVSDWATPDQTYFTSNKDINPIKSGVSHWGCAPLNNPLAKDDIQNAYAALVQVPANAPDNAGDQVLYLGSERGSNNGTSFAGFWLLKDPSVGCSGTNAFSGQHEDGDILIISNYTNGGGTQDVQVYKWQGDDATGQPVLDATFNGGICSQSLSNDNSCAIANSAAITTPWTPTSHDSNTFVETGIDLTTLLGSGGGCFTNFLAETRSSAELTATLKDFAGGKLDTCVPPTIDTTATPGGSSVPLGATNQHDVATVAAVGGHPDPTGTLSFFLCNPSQVTAGGCESGGTQVGSAVTIANGSATSANADGSLLNTTGKYCWRAEYTPDSDGAKFYVAGSDTNSTTECFTVAKNSPSIVTDASVTGGGVVGTGTTCDSATLSGSFSGTGTITFTLTAPDSSVATVGSVQVSGNGTYQSPSCPLLTQVGTYTWSASYSGDSLNNGAVDNGDNESVTSIPASPSLVTDASTTGDGVVGTDTTCDSATLSGSFNGTGTITFTLTAPDNSSAQVGQPVTVTGDGTYQSPSCPLLTQVGTYTWHAVYSGDSLNSGAQDNGANESVTSIPASPSLVTDASVTGGGVVGTGTTCDSATLSGSFNGTGTITFTLTAPDNSSAQVGQPVTVTGDGTYQSPSCPLLTQVGTYTWHAVYSGDSLNDGAQDNGDNESVTSVPTTPSIVTTQDPASGSAGDTYKDKATLSDTYQLDGTGSITWTLYPNADCSGTPLGTDTVTGIDSNGPFETPTGVTVKAAGTYYWVAKFSGDQNNGEATSGCADEPVTVKGAAIHIKKTADAAQVSAGDQIGFTMTVWNSGDGDAKGVQLSDPLPSNPGLSWQIAGQGAGWNSTCKINGNELDCGPVTVPAGTTQENSTFTVHITSVTDKTTAGDCEETGLVDNTGTVTTTNDGTDQSSAEVCVATPAIHIVKTADAAQVTVGQDIGFTMTVYNSGAGDAHGVMLTDVLPTNPGLSWSVDHTGAGFGDSCSIAAGVLSCGPVTVPAGTTQAASTFTVHITSHTTGATGGDCPKTGVVTNTGDVTTTNDGTDESSASTCVQALVDLSITKSGSPATQQLGSGNITWTMVVTNNGPSDDSGVKISDPMPAGNTYVSSTTTQGTCSGGPILTCDIGPMAAGASVTITLVTTPSAVGPQTNTVVVSGDRSETNLANNTASATVQITGAPFVPCINIKRITPGHLLVGRKTVVTIYLQGNGRPVKGTQVRIKGAGVNVKTKGASGKGVIKHTLKMKRKGILTFTPIQGPASQTCSGKRIGVRGVFTPPVTG